MYTSTIWKFFIDVHVHPALFFVYVVTSAQVGPLVVIVKDNNPQYLTLGNPKSDRHRFSPNNFTPQSRD